MAGVVRISTDLLCRDHCLIFSLERPQPLRKKLYRGRQICGLHFLSYNIRFITLNDNVDTANKDSTALDIIPMPHLSSVASLKCGQAVSLRTTLLTSSMRTAYRFPRTTIMQNSASPILAVHDICGVPNL